MRAATFMVLAALWLAGCMPGIRPDAIEFHTEVASRRYAQPLPVMARKTALAMYALGWMLDAEYSQPPYLIEATAPASRSTVGGRIRAMLIMGKPEGTTVIQVFSRAEAPISERGKNEERVRQLFEKIEARLSSNNATLPAVDGGRGI
jgi:hypothetical protein